MTRQVAIGPDDLVCPLHKKKMSEVCHKCPWWADINTLDQDGNSIKQWACAIAIAPLLQINVAREVSASAKETETFRKIVTEGRLVPPPIRSMREITSQ